MRTNLNTLLKSSLLFPVLAGGAIASPLVHAPYYISWGIDFPPEWDGVVLLQDANNFPEGPPANCEPGVSGSFLPETDFAGGGFTGEIFAFYESGHDVEGTTSGGFKELELAGTNIARFWGSSSTDGKSVGLSGLSATGLFDGGGFPELAHFASLGYVSEISSIFRISGLPTDRFNATLPHPAGYVEPGHDQQGGVFTAHGLSPGHYRFVVTDSGLLRYECGNGWSFGPLPALGGNGNGVTDVTMTLSRNESAGEWSELAGGLSSRAWAFLPQADSLIVGGTFVQAAGVTVNRIARWDGDTWTRFASGLNGGVLSLAEFNGEIIAGGGFTRAVGDNATEILRVARWDGVEWHAMGDGFNARVNALAVHNGVLYAGGNFTQSGGTQVSRLARWHPESARWISAGEFDGNVFALASVSSSKLIVGGEFSIVDGTPARALVGGEPGSWQAVASIDGSVYALSPDTIERPDNFFLPDRTSLAVGGEYVSGDARNIGLLTVETFSGPVIIDHLESLGQGVNGRVNTIYAHQSPNYGDLVGASVIVIGGEFTEADGRSANRIARCDLGSDRHYWSGFGDGVDDFVGAVSMFNDEVVITGEFTATGARPANRLVRWTLDPLSSCLGDANGDGVVNFSDLNAVLTDFGETGSGNPGDINGDGVINFEDLNTVLTNFGFVCE